jgi:thiol-disulfide isomerase/thioredoxin
LSLLIAALFALAAFHAAAAAIGDAAPAFSLPTAAGEAVSLEKLRGKVVYVDFWASWCAPCKRSFPWMNDMQAKYGPRGLAIVAINVDRKRADADRFLEQAPARFSVVYDSAGVTPAAYGVRAMPSSYLIDASGRVVDVELGFREERKAELEQRIRALVGAP